tara:strand:+ start:192 stop:455 length:264 start_codon:yes stop_codon:yes gene_type:complete
MIKKTIIILSVATILTELISYKSQVIEFNSNDIKKCYSWSAHLNDGTNLANKNLKKLRFYGDFKTVKQFTYNKNTSFLGLLNSNKVN